RRPDATERLVEFADTVRGQRSSPKQEAEWRELPLAERLAHALVHGIVTHVDEDVAEALASYPDPLSIIEGPLMDGMNVVGERFGAGKMFLPQVVKSARVMKKAVAILEPLMRDAISAAPSARARIVMATVKGDVHDIGKNIVGAVLACNNYEIVDLGVMVPADKIIETARRERADLIGLSGLITPSLDEMVHVAAEMQRQSLQLPLLIGGATTSAKHTAIKIAPAYSGLTVHVTDASRAVDVVGQLSGKAPRDGFAEEVRRKQDQVRRRHDEGEPQPLRSYAEAQAARASLDRPAGEIDQPEFVGHRTLAPYPLGELIRYIDWTPFFHVWELRGVFPRILDDDKYGESATELFHTARQTLDRLVDQRRLQAAGVYGFYPANRDGDDIIVWTDAQRTAERLRFHTLRQQRSHDGARPSLALADFVADRSGPCDFVGAFAVTAGIGLDGLVAEAERDHDDYSVIMLKALADRLAEAFAERLHEIARGDWGYGKDERLSPDELLRERFRGIRPAPGYPACPDHSEKRTLWRLLDVERETGIRLTESYAMQPAAAVCGLYFAHPAARYFSVGPIGRDQVASYAHRKGWTVADAERWLRPNLAYEPSDRSMPAEQGQGDRQGG
ncbi:MAG TPA: vitamin B12 dependent-methionine synthase activation domain-containing protein, partial [Candidatus Polarisedimenticolaceae bacterium]|nr:vitamin B12 dependent-methionine synthase activation domain-containing protein [Candidatus Polarisedimenticolaceae bacterium]